MLQLVEDLKKLKESSVVGVKQSFEDEGVLLGDLILMRRICDLSGMKLSIKIGGCEAISDLINCLKIGADFIVAPMIESEFALQKYHESTIHNVDDSVRKRTSFYINIESTQAITNLEKILESPSSNILDGIVIGRSDLVKSLGYGKQDVANIDICKIIKSALNNVKKSNMTTLMGGSIGRSSIGFICELFENQLLDYIETRNVILKLNDSNISVLNSIINQMLVFESNWLKFKYDHYVSFADSYKKRSDEILTR